MSITELIRYREVSDLNGDSPQFTLTCISTGGPATTVTWTRDSEPATGEMHSVLDDSVTAQYTHTLTVTGGQEYRGIYTCNVSNNKPSSASASYTITGIYIIQHILYHVASCAVKYNIIYTLSLQYILQLHLLQTSLHSVRIQLIVSCLNGHLQTLLELLRATE